MNPQLLYQEDSTVLEFDAEVVKQFSLPNGRRGLVLDRTYFYPTGGGQEHDTGRIGTARVVDVYKDETELVVVHVIEGQVSGGTLHASIDAERRLRHMQHHTAQHLLTQCILRQASFETVSANINGYSPSTLDIIAPQISKADLVQAERMANMVVYEDRPVKTYFVTPDQLQFIPLRRPPKVSEDIRIVEIDGYDYSPCGGTHVLRTGSIGLVKVLKAERQNEKQRVHFVAGLQALDVFDQMYDSTIGLANQLSMAWQDIPAMVGKQAEQVASMQKELQTLRQAGVKVEAQALIQSARVSGAVKSVLGKFTNRPAGELRLLAEELKKAPDVVSCLTSYDGQKVVLIITCGAGTGMDARQLLNRQLAYINGRGGGDARLAQGGGSTTPEQYASFLSQIDVD